MERAVKMVTDVRTSFDSDQDAVNAVAGILGIEDADMLREWLERRDAAVAGSSKSPLAGSLKRFATRSHTIIIGVAVTVLGGLGLAYSQQVSESDSRPPASPRRNWRSTRSPSPTAGQQRTGRTSRGPTRLI